MMSLMDVIQRGYYAGVDPAICCRVFQNQRRDGHYQAARPGCRKTFAPLLVMADQASMAGESAGNAYRKIFRATLNNKKSVRQMMSWLERG